MKGSWNWKKFLALFMAIAMVMASGIFVTTQSFQATDDESYEQGNADSMETADFDSGEEESESDSDDGESVTEEQQIDLDEGSEEESMDEGEDASEEESSDEMSDEGSDSSSDDASDESSDSSEEGSSDSSSDEGGSDSSSDEGSSDASSSEGDSSEESASEEEVEKFTLTIRYVDEEENALEYRNKDDELTTDDYTEELADGEDYSVTSPEIEGYELADEEQEKIEGTLREDTEILVTYKAVEAEEEPVEEEKKIEKFTLTIRYVDEEDKTLESSHTEELEKDTDYSVKSPEIEEYELADNDQETIKGTITENTEITVAYKKIETKEEEKAEEEEKKAEDEEKKEEEKKEEEKAEEAATESEKKTDDEGYLLDENGERVLSEDGEPLKADDAADEKIEEVKAEEEAAKKKVDEEGYLLDENGERILDEEGNPIKAEDAEEKAEEKKVDEEGYLLDENGERILDENGNPIKAEDLAALEAKVAADAAAEAEAAYLPAGYFQESTPKGITVQIGYGEKIFPAGTTMVVKDVSDDEALELAQEVDENISDAVAVDISFWNAQGEEIQPEGRVEVSITASQSVGGGDEATLIHVPDDGVPEEIKRADTDANSAEFSTSEFSKFILAGSYVDYADASDLTREYNGDACDTLTLESGYIQVKYYTNHDGEKVIIEQHYLGGVWKIESGEDIVKAKDNQQYNWQFGDNRPFFDIVTTGKPGDGVVTFTATAPTGETFVIKNIIHVRGYTAHFNANGGQGSIPDVTVAMGANSSTLIQMPKGDELSREGYELVGWSTDPNEMSKGVNARYLSLDDGNENTTDDTYCMPVGEGSQDITFYAMWVASTAVSDDIGFYIRKDGIIQTEPSSYASDKYYTLLQTHSDDLRDYITYVKTEINLDQIKKNITQKAWDEIYAANESLHLWDPDTQYVQWYVIKHHSNGWHVDGVIRSSSDCNLDYHTNCKDYSGSCPPSKQYPAGTQVKIGGDEPYTITRTGYKFGGWNTAPDGSGVGYHDGDVITLKKNIDLYAVWVPNASTPYTLHCYDADTNEEISNATKYRVGTTGNSIKANDSDKYLQGYEFDEGNPNNVLEAIIADDGTTDLKLYFKKVLDVQVSLTDESKVYDKQPITIGVASVTVNGEQVESSYNNGTVTFTYGGKTYTIANFNINVTGDNMTVTNAGTYDVTAPGTYVVSVDGKATKNTVTVTPGIVRIAKRTAVVRSNDGTWPYDGRAHKEETVTITGDGFLEGDEPKWSFSGVQKAPGSSENLFSASDANKFAQLKANYTISLANGTLTVTSTGAKYEINIRPKDATAVYDGSVHEVNREDFIIEGGANASEATSLLAKLGNFFSGGRAMTFSIGDEEFTISGLAAVYEAENAGKDAGSYRIIITGSETIKDSSGHNVTEEFSVNKLTGTMAISKRPVTLKSADLVKKYDGTALKNPDGKLVFEQAEAGEGVTIQTAGSISSGENEGFAEGEGVTFSFSGIQRKRGFSQNTFTVAFNENTKETNYNISIQPGTLTVSNGDDAKFTVEVVPNAAEVLYDGQAHTVSGFENETGERIAVTASDGETYYVSGLTAGATGTDAGTYTVSYSGTPIVEDAENNVVTKEFNVNVKPVSLVIKQRALTLTSASLRKVFDGKALQNPQGSITVSEADGIYVDTQGVIGGDGLATTDTIAFAFNGIQMVTGTSANTFTYTINGQEEGQISNYVVTKGTGNLTVGGRGEEGSGTEKYEVMLVPNGRNMQYDGKEHTISGFRNESGDKGVAVEVDGETYFVTGLTASVTATDVGKHAFTINGTAVVKTADGQDVTSEFIVKTDERECLNITKRTVIMHSASLTKDYDGKALKNPGTELVVDAAAAESEGITINENGFIAGDGFAEGEGATYNFTGNQLLPDESKNEFAYTLNEGTKAENYEIRQLRGMLTVRSRDALYDITITAKSDKETQTYDGKEHVLTGFEANENQKVNEDGSITVTVNGIDFTVSGVTAEAKGTDAGDYQTEFTGEVKVTDEDGNDVTEQFNVAKTQGILTIKKAKVTMTSASLSKPYDGTELKNPDGKLTFEESEAGNGVTIVTPGSVTGFAEGQGASYSFSGSRTVKGDAENAFSYTLNEGTKLENYDIEQVPGTLTVGGRGEGTGTEKLGATIVANSSQDGGITYDGKEHSVSGFVGQNDDGSVTVEVGGVTYTISGLTAEAKGTDAGTYQTTEGGTAVVKDEQGNDVSDEFDIQVTPGTLTINKATVTLKSADLSKEYDGKPLENGATAMETEDGWAEGEGATYEFTGSQTVVGFGENTYNVNLNENTKAENYTVVPNVGSLEVKARGSENLIPITVVPNGTSADSDIEPNGGTFEYDGTEHTVSGFKGQDADGRIPVEIDGVTYYVSGIEATATAKDVNGDGIQVNITGTPVVKDAQDNVVTDQFNIEKGTTILKITPRALTLTSKDVSKKYDGNVLTNGSEPLEAEEGWAEGEGATYEFTGSQLVVGKSPNAFTINVNEGTKLENYTLTKTEGWLEVTSRTGGTEGGEGEVGEDGSFHVTVYPNSGEEAVKYDGNEHTVSGFKGETEDGIPVHIEGVEGAFYVSGLTAEAKGTDAGEYKVEIGGKAVVKDSQGNDVTDQFTVDVDDTDAKLVISKRTVTMKSKSGEFTYDGTVHKLEEFEDVPDDDGWLSGDEPKWKFSGQQKAPGSSDNSFAEDGSKLEKLSKNYDVTIAYGTLLVNGPEAKYEISIKQVETPVFTYDGKNHTVEKDDFMVEGAEGITEDEGARSLTEILGDFFTRTMTVKFAMGGDTYTLTGLKVTGGGKDAGEYPITIDGTETIKDSDGTDVTAQFVVKKETGKLKINKQEVILKSADLNKKYNGEPLVNGNTKLAEETGWIGSEGATYTFDGKQTAPGESSNHFTYELKDNTKAENYDIKPSYGILKVESTSENKIQAEITPVGGEFTYNGQEQSVSGFVEGQADKGVPVTASNGKTYFVAGYTAGAAAKNAGETEVVVTADDVHVYDENGEDVTTEIEVTPKTAMLKIKKIDITMASASLSKAYDGKPLMNPDDQMVTTVSEGITLDEQGSVTGEFVAGEGVTITFKGSRTLKGEAENTFEVYPAGETILENYNIIKIPGKLTVKGRGEGSEGAGVDKLGATIVANSSSDGEFTYDGKEHSVSGFVGQNDDGSVTVEVGGVTYTISGLTSGAAGTDAKTYETTTEGTAVVKDAEGNDVSDEFDVQVTPGTLTIGKATVTLKSADLSKEYDGKPLTNGDTAMETEEGWAEGEGATYEFTGSQTVVGFGENTYSVNYNENTNADNYTVVPSVGSLEVTARGAENLIPITVVPNGTSTDSDIEPNGGTFEYDGTEHTVSGFKGQDADGRIPVEIDGVTYYVSGIEATATAKDVNGDGIQVNITGTPVVTDAEGQTVTDQFNIVRGTTILKITPRALTLTSKDLTKVYDGTPLVNGDEPLAAEAGWAEGEGATYTFTGSQTVPNETGSPNAFTITPNEGTNLDNYTLTKSEGTLIVTSRSAGAIGEDGTITLTANSKPEANADKIIYDGKEHSVSGFIGQNEDGSVTVTVGGQTYTVSGVKAEAKGTAAGTYETEVTYTNGSKAVVTDAAGNDVSSEFNVEVTKGSLTISKRKVTVTSKSGEFDYDGTVHTLEEFEEAGGDGWLNGDEPAWNFTGKQKAPGKSDNTYEAVGTKLEDLKANYDVTLAYGMLEVKSAATKFEINVTPKEGIAFTYDGQKHSVGKDDFTIGGNVVEQERSLAESIGDFFTRTMTVKFAMGGDIFELTGLRVTGGGTDAGEYDITFEGTESIKDSDGHDVTDQFLVNKGSGKLTINKAPVTLTSATLTQVYTGTALTNGNSPIMADGFIGSDGATYTFSGSQTAPGSSPNAFDYELSGQTKAENYTITKVPGTLTVTSNPENARFEIMVQPNGSSAATPNGGTFKYDGKPHTVSGFVNEADGKITVTASNGMTYYVSGLTAEATLTDVGKTNVAVTGNVKVTDEGGNDVSSEFIVKPGTAEIEITKRSVILRSASLSKQYDGSVLMNPDSELVTTAADDKVAIETQGSIGGDGFAEGEGATYTFEGRQTLTGESPNSFNYTLAEGTKADNYEITKQTGILHVGNRDAKYPVVIPAKSDETATYDGKPHTVGGFVGETEDGIPYTSPDGKTYYITGITAEVTATDAGEYTTQTNGSPVVKDADGNDVTDQFDVTTVPGKLVINKATVMLQSADLDKTYDGKPLVNGTTPMAVETGWVIGEGATYTFSGSQTIVGQSPNSYSYRLNENTKEKNYNIIQSEGTLRVDPRGDGNRLQIKIRPNSGKFEYDGQTHTVSGFEGEENGRIPVVVEGVTYYVSGLTSTASAKDVNGDGIRTTVTGTAAVKDAEGHDVTGQFVVTSDPGTIQITKKPLTLVSDDLEKNYDGTPLTNGDKPLAKEDGWVDGEGADYEFTGSQRIVGMSANAFNIIPNSGTRLDNYDVNKTEGTLNVTNANAPFEVTIEANSGEFTYDGQAHTVKGFKNEEGGRIKVQASNGQTYYVSGLTSEKTAANVADSGRIGVVGTWKVADEQGADVSSEFNVKVEQGTLTIKVREITLTSEDRTKVYDGYPLTNGDGKITVDDPAGLLTADSFIFTFTGSQTLIGESPNSFTFAFKATTRQTGNITSGLGLGTVLADGAVTTKESADNYDIKSVYGSLTVTAKDGVSGIADSDVVSKTHENDVYTVGQKVTFTIKVKNPYADARTITIREQEGMELEQSVFTNVAPGATVTTKATHVVTEADALAGGFTNKVSTDISGGSGGDGTDGGDDLGGSGGGTYAAEDPVVVQKSQPSLAVFKTSDATAVTKAGDTITYTINVVNNGSAEITGINVVDDLTGESWTIDSLAAGTNKSFTTTYKVTEADVANGTVRNIASVMGAAADGADISTSGSADVTISQSYILTIHYVDGQGNRLAGDYVGSYQYQSKFRVQSPQISGYTPSVRYVDSPDSGMPAKDIELTVEYLKNQDTAAGSNSSSGSSADSGSSGSSSSSSDSGTSLRDKIRDRLGLTNNTTGTSTIPLSDTTSGTYGNNGGNGRDTADTSRDTDNSEGTNAGVRKDGSTTSTAVRTPAINNDVVAGDGIEAPGAKIEIGDDGMPHLVQADDTETPLSAFGLGGEKCDIIPFIFLLMSMIMVIAHTDMMKKKQARIFELRKQLEQMNRK